MTSGSSASVFANQVASTTWGETTTTYSNAPAIGAQVAASGAFSANAYVSMDVTSVVTGNGLVSFAVRRTNTAAIAFNAREAAATNRPQLVVATTSVSDTTAPSVSLSAPTPGAVVAGSAVSVSASASDNVGVAGVQFKLDGANLGAEDTSAPYSISWDTTGVANGPHTLTAVARDAGGQHGDCRRCRGDGVERDGSAERAGFGGDGLWVFGCGVGRCIAGMWPVFSSSWTAPILGRRTRALPTAISLGHDGSGERPAYAEGGGAGCRRQHGDCRQTSR